MGEFKSNSLFHSFVQKTTGPQEGEELSIGDFFKFVSVILLGFIICASITLLAIKVNFQVRIKLQQPF